MNNNIPTKVEIYLHHRAQGIEAHYSGNLHRWYLEPLYNKVKVQTETIRKVITKRPRIVRPVASSDKVTVNTVKMTWYQMIWAFILKLIRT